MGSIGPQTPLRLSSELLPRSTDSLPLQLRSSFQSLHMRPKNLTFTEVVTRTVKNLPAMLETRVRSLGGEDFLEKGMATHSSIFAWRIPWTEEPGRLQSMGSQRV